MQPWFRFHHEALDDPKVQRLEPFLFKFWVNLLCLASRHEGKLPSVEDVSFALRETQETVSSAFHSLMEVGLLDDKNGTVSPHNWSKRQYKSDKSSDRVKRYRDRRRESGLPIKADYSEFRAAILDRDGEQCVYCLSTENLVVDHVTPTLQSGTDDLGNLVLACRKCNSRKAGRTPEQAGYQILIESAAESYCNYVKRLHVTAPDSDSDTEQKEEKKDTLRVSKEKAPTTAKRGSELETDWQPSESSYRIGEREGYSREEIGWLAEGFTNHSREKRRLHKAPDRAFQNWMRSAISRRDIDARRKQAGPNGVARGNGTNKRLEAIRELATGVRRKPNKPNGNGLQPVFGD